MSKDIWHKPSETPDVFKSYPIIVVYEAGDEIEQMDSTEYNDLVGERYVNRWCYVDELIKENEHIRKALDVAKDALDAGKTLADIAGFKMLVAGLEEALEQITALEQKDK